MTGCKSSSLISACNSKIALIQSITHTLIATMILQKPYWTIHVWTSIESVSNSKLHCQVQFLNGWRFFKANLISLLTGVYPALHIDNPGWRGWTKEIETYANSGGAGFLYNALLEKIKSGIFFVISPLRKKFDIFRHFRLFEWTTCGSKYFDTFGFESWNTNWLSINNSPQKFISCWKSWIWKIESETIESSKPLCTLSAIGGGPKARSNLIPDLQKRRYLSIWTSSVKQASI